MKNADNGGCSDEKVDSICFNIDLNKKPSEVELTGVPKI